MSASVKLRSSYECYNLKILKFCPISIRSCSASLHKTGSYVVFVIMEFTLEHCCDFNFIVQYIYVRIFIIIS